MFDRKSVRLKGFDYSTPGAYFVTICTYQKQCLFGVVENGEMKLCKEGKLIDKWWKEMPIRFPQVKLDEYIIMPDHMHGVLWIGNGVGATRCGRPRTRNRPVEQDMFCSYGFRRKTKGDHAGSPVRPSMTLGKMIGWFKTMTSNEYINRVKECGWEPFGGKVWQRNYYEHIIRNDIDLMRIRKYIQDNPTKWEMDY
jgi:putative transposase